MANESYNASYNITRTNYEGDNGTYVTMRLATVFASVIFVLAVVGNGLVILTVVLNKRMRTVTNVFLLNLAVSDMLLAVFCMPFTLIPILMRNFIFGPFMCISIRYAQGVSVGASCFTLVAISMERYFAICRPLQSRRWQTLSHSYKVISICWIIAVGIAIPIAISTRQINIATGASLCREIWDNSALEQTYTVLLDGFLLFIPLCIMTGAYTRIMLTLCSGMNVEYVTENYNGIKLKKLMVASSRMESFRSSILKNGSSFKEFSSSVESSNYTTFQVVDSCQGSSTESTPRRKIDQKRFVRQTNHEKSQKAKLRVVKMLFVLVIEFFVCWTPLYTVQTWKSVHEDSLRSNLTETSYSVMFLLSYASSCCNPITYCFMNRRFRQSFICAFESCCCCCKRKITTYMSRAHTNRRRLTWLEIKRIEETELSSNDKLKMPSNINEI